MLVIIYCLPKLLVTYGIEFATKKWNHTFYILYFIPPLSFLNGGSLSTIMIICMALGWFIFTRLYVSSNYHYDICN